MSSSCHHFAIISAIACRFSSDSSLSSSMGISSGPGAFLLFSFLMISLISSMVGMFVLYVSCSSYVISVASFCGSSCCVSSLLFVPVCLPHWFLLRCSAAFCARSFHCTLCPFLSLLWYGVGLYFVFSALIPSHLSLMSNSCVSVLSTSCFLSSFLLFSEVFV